MSENANLRKRIAHIESKVRLYLSVGRFNSAEKLMLAAISDYGQLANFYLYLGVSYHFQSRFPEAVLQFHKALEINPEYSEAGIALGVTLCDLGQYEKAAEILSKKFFQGTRALKGSAQALGKIANTHAKNGHNYLRLGDQSEAITEFRKALQIFPSMPDVRLQLASLYCEMNHLEKAELELTEIIKTHSDTIGAETLLGIVFFKQGKKDFARDHWLKAQQLDPTDRVSRAYLKLTS